MSVTRPAALAGVSFVAVVVLLVPAATGSDGFPISTHPMYASVRDAEDEFVTAVAFDTAGKEVELDIVDIAGTDDPLVARRRMASAREDGRLGEQCGRIADRVEGSGAARVEIVELVVDVVDYATGGATPARSVLHTCMVGES